ncbi:uncharacterized protein LOC132064135 [Lycium ferocissimum]|uniref:uncharacterized protein LOC132064135 n=1 Tax=Lycium ferocissimum TaxID=112874 RepID=UPI002815764F|nr:uncharacterized protein LOC132064135 [Lycium ferocissimum]
MIDNYKDWHEQLPYALLGYRTTARTLTGVTPYLLVYGTEAVITTEVEIPSLRIIQEAELDNAEWIRKRVFQIGQLVLKQIFPSQEEYKGKFAPNWQGPYMVRKVLSGGIVVLAEMDGQEWPRAINSDAIKRYYV